MSGFAKIYDSMKAEIMAWGKALKNERERADRAEAEVKRLTNKDIDQHYELTVLNEKLEKAEERIDTLNVHIEDIRRQWDTATHSRVSGIRQRCGRTQWRLRLSSATSHSITSHDRPIGVVDETEPKTTADDPR